jgi:hypothetical protein
MLEFGWGTGDERGCQPAASLDDDPMLLEFQLAQVFSAPPGGSTASPVGDSGAEMEITFDPDVQLAAPMQASNETQLANAINSMETDAASAVGRSDSLVSAVVNLTVTASAVAADNIIDEYADLQGVEDIAGCIDLHEAEDIDGCAAFCRKMFRKASEPVLPRPPSPLVADVQK